MKNMVELTPEKFDEYLKSTEGRKIPKKLPTWEEILKEFNLLNKPYSLDAFRSYLQDNYHAPIKLRK